MSKDAIRLVLHQSSANYREPESFDNRRTYPLPPFSTVIGAIHKACGYTETHNMDVSVQGQYGSMGKRVYRDYNFLNSTFDDRGILVKMANESMLSTAFVKVAEPKKNKGNSSYERNINIRVYDQALLEEYQQLKKKGRKIQELKEQRLKPELERLNVERKQLAEQRKSLSNSSSEYESIKRQEEQIKADIKKAETEFSEYERINYSVPYSCFRVLTTSIKQYEILCDIDLIIHITSEDERTMEDIYNHAYDITSLGRSEDFIELISVDRVTLSGCGDGLDSEYSAYVALENVRTGKIYTKDKGFRSQIIGTKYAMPKMYTIDKNGQRNFEKKKVLYASGFEVYDRTEQNGIFVDRLEDGKYYIVNFI